MKYKISLVMATVGRDSEVIDFIKSLINSEDIDLSMVELIIVDQNPIQYDLKGKIRQYLDVLTIVYIHSEVKGLSYCRNIGINNARGEILAFPDDDCKYYVNTLSSVLNFFKLNEDSSMVLGRIYDRDNKVNLFKSWPSKKIVINTFNFYHMSSSVTIFSRNLKKLFFDENMGAGSIYGSCEDPDYIYRALLSGSIIHYTPTIDIWHPAPNMNTISLKKVSTYSSGFGYFISKSFNFTKFFLLLMLLMKKLYQMLFHSSRFKKNYFQYFFKGLLNGLMKKRI